MQVHLRCRGKRTLHPSERCAGKRYAGYRGRSERARWMASGHIVGLEILDARARLGDAVLAKSVPIEQLTPVTVAGACK